MAIKEVNLLPVATTPYIVIRDFFGKIFPLTLASTNHRRSALYQTLYVFRSVYPVPSVPTPTAAVYKMCCWA